LSHEEYAWLSNEEFRPQINRATQENYAPGSILKPLIGLVCLEAGLDPNKKVHVEPYPGSPHRGVIYVGKRKIADLAGPGDYDFTRALKLSSNGYFVSNGIWAGMDRIMELGRRLHLGETTGLQTRQETSGIFPDEHRLARGWSTGDTANICIGQGEIDVTPLQMAVMTAAFANGGNVLWPRLVKEIIDPYQPNLSKPMKPGPSGIRDRLNVQPRNLQILKNAMLADVEDPDGTGRAAAISSVRICGKTGTAQITDLSNRVVGHTTWFISFAPYENPSVAVVIMVEGGSSGGGTCAPLARGIYQVLFPETPRQMARNP